MIVSPASQVAAPHLPASHLPASRTPAAHIQGLPGTLPPGEHILWQSAPDWRSLARHLCHIRPVALYLAIVLAGTLAASLTQGGTAPETFATMAPFLAAAATALLLLLAFAWLIARTTEYTLTTHRLVIRFGIALQATLAIPHRAIAHAAATIHADGTGDLPILTKPAYPVALRRAWPHSRPWHFRHPQPMLRSVPGAAALAPLLARTLAAATLPDLPMTSHEAGPPGLIGDRPQTPEHPSTTGGEAAQIA